jgi:choline-sulfatase
MKPAWILAICCTLAINSAAQQRTAPDIFLVTIDTLRADHVHSYGYDAIQTPAIDSLAKDGVRFAQAFTPSPITNTSHTTILTGLLPSKHGVTDFAVPLAESHATMAELLKAKGYKTAAFIGAVILDSKSLAPGLDRGFDYYDNFPEHSQEKARWGRVERRGMDVVERAQKWLRAHSAGPHFVWIHLYDPHDPYEPPAPFSETYKSRLYDGEIAYADSALQKFLGLLKLRGWYRNSVIVLVGDHGEGLGEHREETHGIFLYDATTHVPLLIKTPGSQAAGKTIEAQVRTTDILPTILQFVKTPSPKDLDGEALQNYWETAETADRVAFGETDYPLRFGWAPLRSVRNEGFKFIDAPRPELYDLRVDPKETSNKYTPADTTAKKLQAEVEEIRAKTPGRPGETASAGAGEKLKALGYAEQRGPAPEGAALPDPKDKIEEQNLLHTAMLASEDGRMAEAQSALEKTLQLDPRSASALRQLGEIELKNGDYAKAAGHLKAAREARPDDATAAYEAGQALAKAADFGGARDALDASLKLLPGQLSARVLLGDVYLKLNDPKNAADQFEAALLVDGNSREAQLGSAQAQIALGNFSEASLQLEQLVKRQPQAEAYELLSKAYEGLGNKEQAQQAAKRAKELGH